MTREEISALAHKHLAAGDVAGWFEIVYAQSAGDPSSIPWADLKPNPNLIGWLDRNPSEQRGRALVVGCGLGDDAEELARRGWNVTGFDISGSAIEWCRKRFADSSVKYEVADLLNSPAKWKGGFDFVFESYTLQALPVSVRARAIAGVASFVGPSGRLLVICRGREADDPDTGPPWPLTRAELAGFTRDHGLSELSFEDFQDTSDDPPARRFRCVFGR